MGTTPQNTLALGDVTVGQAMRHGLVSCLPDDELATVAAKMIADGVHAVAVAPLDRAAPLILTDIDLVRAALTRPGRVRALEITHEPAALLSNEAPLSEAIAMMSERYTRHLLVADPVTGAAMGFVSSLDVAAVLGDLPPGSEIETQAVERRSAPCPTSLDTTSVGSVTRREIVTCAADTSLRTVARTMAERRVHCVAVAGIEHPNEHLVWGLIEDIDLVVAAHGGALSQPAVEFAENAPVAVQGSDSLARAGELMVEHGTSHLVVVGPTGLPASIVSTLDVAAVVAAGVTTPRDLRG